MKGQQENMFKSKYFWMHIGAMVVAICIVIAVVFSILGIYTHHGEKIPIPKLTESSSELALEMAEEAGFEVIVSDSIFVVGKRGGLIVAQNPLPGSFAKEGRKIYVTITKYSADMISIATLPALYGKSYELKKKVLLDGFEIQSSIAGYQFDKGDPGQILKVLLGTDTIIDQNGIAENINIPRGGKLRFILSSKEGGNVEIPDLICKTYDEAVFLTANNAQLVIRPGTSGQYIVDQLPVFAAGAMMERGDSIYIELSNNKPATCPEDTE